jgi:hypothetical protein
MKWQSKKDFKHQNSARNAVISTSSVVVSHVRLEVIMYQLLDAAISASSQYIKTNRLALLSTDKESLFCKRTIIDLLQIVSSTNIL